MDMVSLVTELNSLAIKDLNRFQILSIFAESNWSINSNDITSLRLERHIEANIEEIITTTTKSKWVFFTDTTYGITDCGINEWNELVSKVDTTEESVRTLLRSDNKTRGSIDNIITHHWLTTSFYVMARDIVHHVFKQDDVGTFFTTLKISEVYSNKGRKIKSTSRFYDKYEYNFWCDFLILDLISDGELDFNFTDESNIYAGYTHSEPVLDMSYTENFGPAEIEITESMYDLGPTHDIETLPEFERDYVESIESDMNDEYRPNEIININHTEVPSESVKINVLFTNSESDDIKSSYESDNSSDSDSDD